MFHLPPRFASITGLLFCCRSQCHFGMCSSSCTLRFPINSLLFDRIIWFTDTVSNLTGFSAFYFCQYGLLFCFFPKFIIRYGIWPPDVQNYSKTSIQEDLQFANNSCFFSYHHYCVVWISRKKFWSLPSSHNFFFCFCSETLSVPTISLVGLLSVTWGLLSLFFRFTVGPSQFPLLDYGFYMF
jgi:hypothetical protein